MDDSPANKFIIALGNPGRQYARTRHNVGFRVAEVLANRLGMQDRQSFSGRFWPPTPLPGAGSPRLALLEPLTFMNCSGRAVAELMQFYKVQLQDVLVVLDEAALELGRLRARASGSAGGHNGLADILAAVSSDAVPRLRIGIGAAPGPMDLRDYVLTSFSDKEEPVIGVAVERAADAALDWARRGITYVMDLYNKEETA